ncbi:MAG: DNA-methyltransferase [Oscillospiraceae bacterium]
MIEIDEITLWQGDCLELMKAIPNESVDMILCDLPYGVTSRNQWDCIIPFEQLWEAYHRVVKDNGAIVLNCQQPFTTQLISSNLKEFKYCWVWYKKQTTGFLNAKKQPLRNCEDIAVFYKKQPTYNPEMRKGKRVLKNTGGGSTNYNEFTYMPRYSEMYYPTTLLEIPLPRYKGGHPTQKPVALCEYLIKTYTNEGETVLDNCMGSGTTGVACVNTNRRFIGIELNEQYFKTAEERINHAKSIMKRDDNIA